MCFYFWRKPVTVFNVDLEAEMEEVRRNVEIYNRIVEETRRSRSQDAIIVDEQSPRKFPSDVELYVDSDSGSSSQKSY
nr:hypothetical protein HmN_000506500 [Hymenolepis microstoma]